MKRILVASVALLAILIIVWLAVHLERFKHTEEVGPIDAARRNPYLACERTFAELGLPCLHQPNVFEPPPLDDVAFVWATGGRESERVSRVLLDWVESGGRLVVLLPSRIERRELLKHALSKGRYEFPLADDLGVDLETDYVAPDADDESSGAAKTAQKKNEKPSKEPVTVELGAEPLYVALERDLWIDDSNAQDATATVEYVAQREHGAGRVVFVTSDSWMTNEHIGEHDHARFAWQLATIGGRPAGVWFIDSERQPGLFATIAHDGWMVLASGLALLALWLWKSGARFGPTIPDPPRDRRDFSEHIEATADFLWRRGEIDVLLAAPRAELAQRLALMRPDLGGVQGPALVAELARAAEMDASAVQEALEAEHVAEPASFQRIVRNLARLRSSL